MTDTEMIQDNSSLHSYRTEIPNIVFELGLTPYEFTLYSYYKRVAGDGGACFQGGKKIADKLGMSFRKLTEVKKSLQQPRDELKGLSLITVTARYQGDTHSQMTDLITIEDVWPLNFQKDFRGSTRCKGGWTEVQGGVARGANKEDPSEETTVVVVSHAHPRVGCGNVHNSSPQTLTKKTFGGEVTCSLDDYYAYLANTRQEFPNELILKAWEILREYDRPVEHWEKFLDGTVKRLQLKEKVCPKKDLNQQQKTSRKSAQSCGGEGTKTPRSPVSVAWMKSNNPC